MHCKQDDLDILLRPCLHRFTVETSKYPLKPLRMYLCYDKMYSCAQAKLLSLLSGKDSFAISEDECSTELIKMTTDMVKAFDYSEGK